MSTELTPADARAITDQIKTGVEAVWQLITRAYTERAWTALGYSSWDQYCIREFGTSRLRLPREERPEMVASLRQSGLSIRAIASATGLGRGTVERELASRVPNGTPDIDDDAPVEEVVTVEPPGGVTDQTPGRTPRVDEALARARGSKPTPVIGTDGKTYQPQRESSPRRQPITDEFRRLSQGLAVEERRIRRLAEDDRLSRHLANLTTNRNDLIRFRDVLDGFIDQLDAD